MATWYLYMNGDNSPGYGPTDRNDPTQADNWTNAFTTLATAGAAVSAGDRIYVAHDHAEDPAASTTVAFPNGISNAPVEIICVNRTSGALAYTGGVEQTGTYSYVIDGNVYVHGIVLRGRTSLALINSSSVSARQTWVKCTLGTKRTSSACPVQLGAGSGSANGNKIMLVDCTFKFAATTGRVLGGSASNIIIMGGSLDISEATPAALLQGSRGGSITLIGVDLTNLGTNNVLDTAGTGLYVRLYGCKGTYGIGFTSVKEGCRVDSWCDGSGVYNFRSSNYNGDMLPETTIYRTGGANNGTNSYCLKFVGNAYATRSNWFCIPIANLNQNLSGKRITVFAARKSAAGSKLNSAQCWMTLVAPDDASALLNPYSTAPTSPLAAGSTYDDSTETWATLTSPYQWKMYVDVPDSAVQKGMCMIEVCVAADLSSANNEVYICPKVLIEDTP